MAVIGSMSVNLLMRTGPFEKGIQSARGHVQSLKGTVASLTRGIGGLASAALAAAGVYGMGRMTQAAIESVDALGKHAKQLGIEAQKLRELQHAAEMMDTDQEALVSGLRKLQIYTAEAAETESKRLETLESTSVVMSQYREQIEMLGLEEAKLSKQIDEMKSSDLYRIKDMKELQERLDTVRESIAFNTDSLSAARSASDSATSSTDDFIEALGKLKLAASDLRKLDPADQMLKIADSMKMISSAQDRLQISQKLFGRGNVELVGMLTKGGAEIEKWAADLRNLAGSVTESNVSDVQDFADSITRLKTALGGTWQGFVISIAPGATEIINKIADIAGQMRIGLGMMLDSPTARILFKEGPQDFMRGLRFLTGGAEWKAYERARNLSEMESLRQEGFLPPARQSPSIPGRFGRAGWGESFGRSSSWDSPSLTPQQVGEMLRQMREQTAIEREMLKQSTQKQPIVLQPAGLN